MNCLSCSIVLTVAWSQAVVLSNSIHVMKGQYYVSGFELGTHTTLSVSKKTALHYHRRRLSGLDWTTMQRLLRTAEPLSTTNYQRVYNYRVAFFGPGKPIFLFDYTDFGLMVQGQEQWRLERTTLEKLRKLTQKYLAI